VPTLAGAAQYDVNVGEQAAIAYTLAADTTAFVDACAGGAAITFNLDTGGTCSSHCQNGLSAAIASPSGFTFFGLPAASFVASSNGFVSFDLTTPDSGQFPNNLPSAFLPLAVAAPYWSGLANVTSCVNVAAPQVIVQWTGVDAFTNKVVHAQAILDGSDNSIRFLWATDETALGDFATIGIEDQAGINATVISNGNANAITAGTGKKLTPM
jgi:hypothetical protein